MEIVKTYDLENLKEIVLKEIDVALHAGRDHARINLISAKEIEEILKECMVREEKLKRMFENAVKETDENVCFLDKNLSPVFVEKEHPETEMLENDLEHLYEVVKDKDRELEELRKHLEHLKETISDKNEQLNILISENSELEKKNEGLEKIIGELREERESRKVCFSLMRGCEEVCINCKDSKRCINAVLKKEECYEEDKEIPMPNCFGKFDDRCINCVDGTCIHHGECLEEVQKILNYKSHECYENEETKNV